MKANLKKAFFRRINDERTALESARKPSKVFRGFYHPGALNEWVLHVGGFLMENEVITTKELDIALALVYDYSARFGILFPEQ